MEDYASDVKVVKGLNIANLVLAILSTVLILLGMLAIGLGWVALDTYIADVAQDGGLSVEQQDADHDGHSSHTGRITAFQVDNAWGDSGFAKPDQDLQDAIDEFNEELDGILGDIDPDYTMDDEASRMIVAITMFIIQIFLGIGLLISIFTIVVAALALRSCKNIQGFKRDFVLAIIAAVLSLLMTDLICAVLFTLSAIFIRRVTNKAGLTGPNARPQVQQPQSPVNPQ